MFGDGLEPLLLGHPDSRTIAAIVVLVRQVAHQSTDVGDLENGGPVEPIDHLSDGVDREMRCHVQRALLVDVDEALFPGLGIENLRPVFVVAPVSDFRHLEPVTDHETRHDALLRGCPTLSQVRQQGKNYIKK